MRLLIFLLTALLFYVSQVVNAQQPTFQKTYSGQLSESARRIESASGNGFILVGTSESFSVGGGSDIYLVRIDSNGNILWTRTFGTPGVNDYGVGVQATVDNGFAVLGVSNGLTTALKAYFFLFKVDSSGNKVWTKIFEGGNMNTLHKTMDGGYIMTGSTNIFSSGNLAFYAVKTDVSGNVEWANSFGTIAHSYCLSSNTTKDSGFVLVGKSTLPLTTDDDALLMKIDKNGFLLWAKIYGDSMDNIAQCVSTTNDGDLIIVGNTINANDLRDDITTMLLDSIGNMLWTKSMGGIDGDFISDIKPIGNNDFILCGASVSFGNDPLTGLAIKMQKDGVISWIKGYGGYLSESLISVVVTQNGQYLMAGYSSSFSNNADVYLVKTDGQGGSCQQVNQTWVNHDLSFTIDTISVYSNSGVNIAFDTLQMGTGGVSYMVCNTTVDDLNYLAKETQLKIAPNPVLDKLIITCDSSIILHGNLSIINAFGTVVNHQEEVVISRPSKSHF